MKLFNKDKGCVLSCLNAVLLIWIIAAIVLTISNITHILVKDISYTYEEYKVQYCQYYEEKDSKEDIENECKISYQQDKLHQKQQHRSYQRNLIISIANIFVVSGTLILINKK